MNSSPECGDDDPASAPDTNANVNAGDASLGAVPKKSKSTAPSSGGAGASKKTSAASTSTAKPARKVVVKINKFNNNIEVIPASGEDAPKANGVVASNGLCASHFLNELNEPSCSTHDGCYDIHTADTESDTYSDASTEVLSVSEDGCIYTYKGDHAADLPSSFFDIPPEIPENQQDVPPVDDAGVGGAGPAGAAEAAGGNRQDASSPEMDYLEMDFDPSNNGDGDSVSENEVHMVEEEEQVGAVPLQNGELMHVENEVQLQEAMPSTSGVNGSFSAHCNRVVEPPAEATIASNTVERWVEENAVAVQKESTTGANTDEEQMMPWSCSVAQRTRATGLRIRKLAHCSRGELVSPTENSSFVQPAKKPCCYHGDDNDDEYDASSCHASAMIWSRDEAQVKQVPQIAPSSCGATAVLNVLNALRIPVPSLDRLRECVRTRQRDNDGPLVKYLISRSRAGSTHRDLIEGLHRISNGTIYSRFFHMYPERVVDLRKWLRFWIKQGAIPIATLNLQRCHGTIPDAWHHQMIYGIDRDGIHLTNPLECVDCSLLWSQLCSEPVLLVRRADVVSRWNFGRDLPELMCINDVRWQRLNVVGQVANVVHENYRLLRQGFANASHIRIPAAYSSGITLATTVNSPAYALLKHAPELPLLSPQDAEAERAQT